MAKKHFGRFMALAALSGAVAASISYFLRYRSFHKELDEEFHDFEDDFDDDLKEFEEAASEKPMERSYVPINTERQTRAADDSKTAFTDDKASAAAKSSGLSRQAAPKASDDSVGYAENTDGSAAGSRSKGAGKSAADGESNGTGRAAAEGESKIAGRAATGDESKSAEDSTTITEDSAD